MEERNRALSRSDGKGREAGERQQKDEGLRLDDDDDAGDDKREHKPGKGQSKREKKRP